MKIGKLFGSGRGLIEVLSRHMPEGSEVHAQKKKNCFSLDRAGPASIRSDDLLKANLECYRNPDLLGY
jgi:hypothetical protein